MSPKRFRSPEISTDDSLLERALDDRILSRYVSTVGFSSLASVQECLRHQNQIFKHSGQRMPLPELLTTENEMTPSVVMKARRGFRA